MFSFQKNTSEQYTYKEMQEDCQVISEMLFNREIDVKSNEFLELVCSILARYINSKSLDFTKELIEADIDAEKFWNESTLKKPYKEDWNYVRFTKKN